MTPGMIPGVIESIATSTRPRNERDRVCTLIFDEIALKKNLAYDAAHDVAMDLLIMVRNGHQPLLTDIGYPSGWHF